MGAGLIALAADAQVTSGERYDRLTIRNAMIVNGNGTPASGPADIVIQGNTIAEVVWLDPVAMRGGRARRPIADAEIDATGKYVLPGLINAHGHVQEERGGRCASKPPMTSMPLFPRNVEMGWSIPVAVERVPITLH